MLRAGSAGPTGPFMLALPFFPSPSCDLPSGFSASRSHPLRPRSPLDGGSKTGFVTSCKRRVRSRRGARYVSALQIKRHVKRDRHKWTQSHGSPVYTRTPLCDV